MLFALLAATVTLTSCNPDEPDNGKNGNNGNQPVAEKKLQKIKLQVEGIDKSEYTYTWDGNLLKKVVIKDIPNNEIVETIDFTYINQQLVKIISEGDFLTDEYYYTWDNGKIVKELNVFTYHWPEDMHVKRHKRVADDTETDSIINYYTYTNGKVSQVKELLQDEEPYYYTFLWNGENLSRIEYEDGSLSYEYDKGINPIIYRNMGWELSTYSISLFHIWSANIASKITEEDNYSDGLYTKSYTHTYDKEGYPATTTYESEGETFTVTYIYDK